MTTVVISQPMLFPWPGFFELVSLADIYVHLDDAQFSKGSFTNRVQVKTEKGMKWMTVPLQSGGSFQKISELCAIENGWKEQHRRLLASALSNTEHFDLTMDLFRRVYSSAPLVELLQESIAGTCSLLNINQNITWHTATNLNVKGGSWQRILNIVRELGGTKYVTAHGAQNYLAHEQFESAGIEVEYVSYSRSRYHQKFGEFIPTVSILDALANLGSSANKIIAPATTPWRKFISSTAHMQTKVANGDLRACST